MTAPTTRDSMIRLIAAMPVLDRITLMQDITNDEAFADFDYDLTRKLDDTLAALSQEAMWADHEAAEREDAGALLCQRQACGMAPAMGPGSVSAPWTPGPWRVPEFTFIGGEYIGTDKADICEMANWGYDLEAEQVANAHLIAAAPELFDALDRLQGWLAHFAEADFDEIAADGGVSVGMVYQQDARVVWTPIVTAALSKARGEAL